MRTLLLGAAGLVGLVLVVVLGVMLLGVWSRSVQVGPAPAAGNILHAQYAGGLGQPGFTLDVAATQRDVQGLPSAASGLPLVRVELSFANSSARQQRADPGDFSLTDAAGVKRRPVTGGPSCPAWPVTDLHAAANDGQPGRDPEAQQVGPSFGPVPLCFQVAGDPHGALRLGWDPDVSVAFLSSPVEITLPAAPRTL